MESDQKQSRTSRTVIMVSVVLLVSMLMSALPQMDASAVTCKYKHTVAQGETLMYIGNLYTVDYLEIAKANNLQPPYVVTAGQILCIPSGTAPANGAGTTKGDNKAKPTLDIQIQMGHVYVSVENFAARTSYFVRMYARNNGVSYRIGNFTTNKEGDWAGWLKIPQELPRERIMQVCVKNAWTDAVSCARQTDQTFIQSVYIKSYCRKEGR
jgi:LysM repeat protein